MTIQPARKWTIHLIPHVHLDIGYTDYQAKVAELHNRNLDRALAALRANPQFAFSVDGSFVLKQYLDSRTPERAEEVLDAVRSGRLGVNALYALLLAGVAGIEECYRAAYYYSALARAERLPMRYANLTDVPAYPWSMPSMLAALGIPAVMVMANHEHMSIPVTDELTLHSPCRWQGPDGATILAFFADHYAQLPFMASDPPTVVGLAAALADFIRPYERDDYLPHDLPLVGTHMDNEDLAAAEGSLVARWNARFAYPRLVYATVGSYLDTVAVLGDQLPVVHGDAGSNWEDGVTAHAKVVAELRDAQAAMLVAETATALTSLVARGLRAVRVELDRAWEGLLIGCEHTWTSRHATVRPGTDQEVDQLDWKAHHIHTATRVGRDETRRAMSQLGELITTDGPSLVLFNPLSWERRDEVQVELPVGSLLRDSEGSVVPVDVIDREAGVARVRFRTGLLPPLGYRVIRVEPREEEDAVTADPANPVPIPVVETDRYRTVIDPVSGHL
ncbi:MAG: hypothetical protein J2P17_35605, partial [Mycobacterium sp.]|nr:hypothetical protein [Mycobacterium sp.]